MSERKRLLPPDATPEEEMRAEGFLDIATNIGKLVGRKDRDYGAAHAKTGAILRILYPEGIKPEQYDDMLSICRVLDKIFRIAVGVNALKENPWADLSGYGILGVARRLHKK